MKKTRWFFLLCLFAGSLPGMAQPHKEPPARKNEIGIDATYFLKQFGLFSQTNYYYDVLQRQMNYRRFFTKGNLRIGLGGSLNTSESIYMGNGDTLTYIRTNGSIYSYLGWEFSEFIHPRWEVFYGLDLGFSANRDYYERPYPEGDYRITDVENILGLSGLPFLGFRFHILPRLSLTTETSVYVQVKETKNRLIYNPINPSIAPKADYLYPVTQDWTAGFQYPINVSVQWRF